MKWLKDYFKAAIQTFLPSSEATVCKLLNWRNIYIFPSLFGGAFMLTVALIWLGATNYQNALALMLAWWLMAIFIAAIFTSFNNFNKLSFSIVTVSDAVVDAEALVTLKVRGKGRSVELRDGHRVLCFIDSVEGEQALNFRLKVPHRGHWQMPEIKVLSYYPFRFWRCWSTLKLAHEGVGLVAPQVNQGLVLDYDNERLSPDRKADISDHLSHLEAYREGHSRSAIDWKSSAKADRLLTKTFEQQQSDNRWISFQCTQGDVETRLSIMVHWLLEAERSGCAFGVRLPGKEIGIGAGKMHQARCWRMISLYGASSDV